MTKRMHSPTFLALLIAAMLAGAYVIVARSGSATSGSGGQPPAGMFH